MKGSISCISNNTEKYICYSFRQLRFIDSVQFLLVPLDKLVGAKRPEAFRLTAQFQPAMGIYPYEYMDFWKCFDEPKLPPKEAFYSKLIDEHIGDKITQRFNF